MFEAMISGRVDCEGFDLDVSFRDIEELNRAAIVEEADISKISYAILPLLRSRYTLLDSGSAMGLGNGPLLVARDGRAVLKRVAIPGRHTTTNLLMTKLFPNVMDKPEYLFSDIADVVLSSECDAGVLIHEGRLTYRERGLELIADLGLLWEERTGLPLPLGAIVASNRLLPETISAVERIIGRSVRFAMENPLVSRRFVRSHARELSDEVIEAHINMFVNHYSLSLGVEGRAAIKALFSDST
jgi:1,4-dihydroxy-6-naphthoate synthase